MDELEKKLGFAFKDQDLLKEALTHRSYLNENPNWGLPHNERLEYLGDAVLELAVTEDLYTRFPEYPEGQLTVLRAALVNYQMLSTVASELELQKFIFMSRGERADGGRAKEVILANALEALIGAVYLDKGFEEARQFTHRFVLKHLSEILENKSYRDSKSELQELIQEKLRVTPTYKVIHETGPAHKRIFTIAVYFGDDMIAEGKGLSKQDAEVEAARAALRKYQK